MPEEQNVQGEWLNTRVNNFLKVVLGWRQSGASNVDVKCGSNGEDLGLDSVFSYRTSQRSPQQVVLIEAKNRDNFRVASRAALQEWIDRFLIKLERTPPCGDFQRKFHFDDDAQFGFGLLAIWVRDTKTFDVNVLQERLKQISVPQKPNPLYIYVLDNSRITRFCSIHEEIQRLKGDGSHESVTFYFPPNGSDIICDGTVIPIEALFSDILFFKTRRKEYIRSQGTHGFFDAALCFYFGSVQDRRDLAFIELAIKDSGLQNSAAIDIYVTSSIEKLRSEIEDYKNNSKLPLNFKRLDLRSELPDWLGEQ